MLGVICARVHDVFSQFLHFLTASWYKMFFVNHHKRELSGVRFKDGWPHNGSISADLLLRKHLIQ
jgi:hypothetical protein